MTQQPPHLSSEKQPDDNGNPLAILVLFLLFVGVLLAIFSSQIIPAGLDNDSPAAEATTEVVLAATPTYGSQPPPLPTTEPVIEAQADYTAEQVAAGDRIYAGLCFACHGIRGAGVPGLGKPLVDSEFVDNLSDDELVDFMIVGRSASDPENTTGQAMPARGGNPSLTDEDLFHVVAYIRSLNGAATSNTSGVPVVVATVRPFEPPPINALDPAAVPPFSGESGQVVLAPFDPAQSLSDVEIDGASAYTWACASCHADRVELAQTDMTDAEIRDILTNAVPPVAAINTFVHPYRGGHPPLSDEQIDALIVYLRSGN
ncbi:MAG: cytochrome c [Anaerolineae bacterium]|nr:cytochrome c [Anaerolineae bacterium]